MSASALANESGSCAGISPEIAVVGSLNWDIRLTVNGLPYSGETIYSTERRQAPGGKGANQAVAAARLGRRVSMIGAVGNDAAGRRILQRLSEENVGVKSVRAIDGAPTGLAVVLWEQPESTIIFEAGANRIVGTDFVKEVDQEEQTISNADVVLCQCETPVGALESVVHIARGIKILNPAPAVHLDRQVLDEFDVLIPNAFELAALTGEKTPPRSISDVEVLARQLNFPGALIVTMGKDGSVLFPSPYSRPQPGHEFPYTHIPALRVDAVDTTAAGDSFCAGVADALLRRETLIHAAEFATRVAATTTTRHGAMDSLPTVEDTTTVGSSQPKPQSPRSNSRKQRSSHVQGKE